MSLTGTQTAIKDVVRLRPGALPRLARRTAAMLLAASLLSRPAAAEQAVRLFEVMGPRDTFTLGVPAAALDGMGLGPDVARLARTLARDGQVTGWRYTVARGINGLLLRPAGPVALMRSDAIRLESYAAALPVLPLPDAP